MESCNWWDFWEAIRGSLLPHFHPFSGQNKFPKKQVFKQLSHSLQPSGEENQFCKFSNHLMPSARLDAEISMEEWLGAIRRARNSAPGPDGISNKMLKALPTEALQSLLRICNRSYSERIVPPEWKLARVMPIPKVGKRPSDLSSWRPISLLSCTSKAMERVITNRLTWHLERNSHLHESQAGFRRGRCTSTTDNLLLLTTHIRTELVRKKGVRLAVFFDVKGAFDSVWHDGLLLKLARASVTGKMHKWLTDYLRNRGYYVQLGQNRPGTKTTGGGGMSPGRYLSPVLVNAMVPDLS